MAKAPAGAADIALGIGLIKLSKFTSAEFSPRNECGVLAAGAFARAPLLFVLGILSGSMSSSRSSGEESQSDNNNYGLLACIRSSSIKLLYSPI